MAFEEKKSSAESSHPAVIVGALILIALGLAYVRYGSTKKEFSNQARREAAKSVLLEKSSLPASETAPVTPREVSALPNEIRSLISPGAEDIRVRSSNSENNLLLFKITFTSALSVADLYREAIARISSGESWNISYAARTNDFSLIEALNAAYRIRVSGTSLVSGGTEESIEVFLP
jgi:hypothetical protein